MNRLLIDSKFSAGTVIEYAALCLSGWVYENKIESDLLCCELELRDGKLIFTLSPPARVHAKFEREEAICLMLGMLNIGAIVEVDGEWRKNRSVKHAMQWAAERQWTVQDANTAIHPYSHLKLSDLQIIHDCLIDKKISVSKMNSDFEMSRIFPFVDCYGGSYGPLRHRSGNEIQVKLVDNEFPLGHKLSAPVPCEGVYEGWLYAEAGKPSPRRRFDPKNPGPYRDSLTNQWKVAHMLGSVPEEHKSKVYSWVTDCFNALAKYHDTRGGVPIPEVFEIEFDGYRMTATQKFVFRLEKIK
ncbi:MAG: hypothetical protein K2X93_02775 [Candidatus Obscuribacterales bacterium]|nr:hypothetical protein [Candidatus Obscuribacterales bacterium]